MSADERTIEALLRRARRRRAAAAALTGAGLAVGAALGCLALGWAGLASRPGAIGLGVGSMVAGALLGGLLARRDGARIDLEIERRAPDFRNLLVTAAELIGLTAPPRRSDRRQPPHRVRPAIVSLVASRAAQRASRVDAAELFPLQRPALVLAGGLALWIALAAAVPAGRITDLAAVGSPTPGAALAADVEPAIDAVQIVLIPPPHTGLAERTLVDPTRLDVVEGTRIGVSVDAVADVVRFATLEGSRELLRGTEAVFRTELVAAADGFLSLEPRRGDLAGPRRLVGLIVTPDAPPRVRIIEPGRDLFLPEPAVQIPVVATAADDFGLAELRLTYTIVSGSGETFEFAEGELAGRATRDDALSWRIDADLAPDALGLSLGDMVVYRAVARDRRPEAPEILSDAFIVEIVGESAAITGGFALESDKEREALSQRMVIIKTERLLARKGTLSAEDYGAEARRIAAEQRLVRAEFVFMMGGEIQDEVEEAEHEHEVAAGRLELAGRQEMSRAVQWMSQAATMLTDANLEAALPLEQSALEALQSALSRSRYILRTMAPRQSIDLSRRLSGTPGPPESARAGQEAASDPEVAALRRMLAGIAAAAGGPGSSIDRAALADLAEEVVRLDASSEELQGIAADLAAAAARPADSAALLARAMEALHARLDAGLPLAPGGAEVDPELAGAFADEMARAGGGR